MNARSSKSLILMLALAAAITSAFAIALSAFAQGYGGLGTAADGFDVPSAESRMEFPRDHGAHPGFRIEWWYLTANLTGEDGRQYGAQWTLFRSALQPPGERANPGENAWNAQQLWMGHAAVTTPTKHYLSETRSRGAFDLAGAQAVPFKAWINDWSMTASATGSAGIDQLAVTASGTEFAYQLNLTAQGPLIFHGEKGYSVKSAGGQASHYYSQPFYQVQGELDLPGGKVRVTGTAWIDREWSSQPLAQDQHGWDWVSLNFDNGSKLMGFRLRQSNGADFTSATWIASDGTAISIPDGQLKLTEQATSQGAGREVPTKWKIQLVEQGIDVSIEALNNNAWMDTSFPYWEGPVVISGSHSGTGYLEMTGYGAK
ncbi:MAG: lipocalin-like domain-containing protein [Rhizobiaceae bacterium]